MSNQFLTWADFVDSFGREMRIASDVYKRMVESGLQDWNLVPMDFTFVSNGQENLISLGECLIKCYSYVPTSPRSVESLWELEGKTGSLPITEETLMYWALDMAQRGYEFDAEFDAYGGPFDPANPESADVTADRAEHWFEFGLERYKAGDRAAAHIGFSAAIDGDPTNPHAFYSRAIVKNELHTWKAAMRDYDEALRLAPDFADALVNRGSLKDDHDDPQGAILDYDRVLALSGREDQKVLAYFNRGNSRLRVGDKTGACADWRKALALGADYARERIAEHCGP